MAADIIRKSTPLRVEDGGEVAHYGLRKWRVVMEDGTDALCWTPARDEKDKPYPCPFVKGRRQAYTLVDGPTGPKIRPYDVTEFDRQRIISRQACLNSAASLISSGCGEATVENMTGLAELLFRWVNE